MSYRGRGRGGHQYNNNSNNNNNHNNFNNSNSFNPQNTNQFASNNAIPVEILGWNGASPDECIAFISRKCRITVSNSNVDQNTGILTGFVKSEKDANDLLTWSGVKFAGQSLKMKKSNDLKSGGVSVSVSGPGSIPGSTGNNTIETITNFLKSRYQPDIKLLNLLSVQQDPGLASTGFFASISTTSKFFPALMKIAGDLKLDVTSVDLSNNNLNDLTTISSLAHTFPLLKNLSLLNNNFNRLKTFESWKHKLNFLRELIIFGNPLVNTTNPNDALNIKVELMKTFPRLIVLNGEILRNEEALNNLLTFPFPPPQPMFFQDGDIQNVSTSFVANYFKLWDTDRSGLMVLYQNESQFSMQVDSAHPHTTTISAAKVGPSSHISGPDFGYYIPQSRNLTRVSSAKARFSRVATGPEQIFKHFSQLPKTRHDLMTKPEIFSMESSRFPHLNGIMITLHGSFDELSAPDNLDAVNNQSQGSSRNRYGYNQQKNKKIILGPKNFDRTFIIIPTLNGSMIVASDLLLIRPFNGPEPWNDTRDPAQSQSNVPPSLPGQTNPSPSPAPGIPGVANPSPIPIPTPTAADLPPEIKANFNIQQQEILVRILLETKLNLQYGIMLCEQSNWDYQQASMNFKNSVGSLPPDAFVQ